MLSPFVSKTYTVYAKIAPAKSKQRMSGDYKSCFSVYSIRKGIIMKVKHIIRMSIVALGAALCLQTSSVMADLVTTDKMAPQSQVEADKLKIETFVERAEVKERLQALGVVETMSRERVAAMTDEEVHALAQKIDTMPAGGRVHDSDLILVLLIVILILII
jgi:hypothetical protein